MKKTITIFFALIISSSVLGQDLRRHMNLRGEWKFSIGDHKEWSTTEYDDSDWEEIYVPRRWEREGFNGYDGYAWYRKSFDGASFDRNKTYFIRLGYIDDVDEVFINGTKIGFSGGFPPNYYTAWNAEREYKIPGDILNYGGENLISVRVFDKGGEGGIYSGEVGILESDVDVPTVHNLEGIWKIRVADREEFADPEYNDENWEDILVPSNWRTIGIRDLKDFAWYRKGFELVSDADLNNMTLIGGRIDDFDEIFVNGVKVGQTNDDRRLGRSRSFMELRVYDIPDGVLKKGKNVISVRVEDIGANGGIYEGPVLLVPTRDVDKFVKDEFSWWR